MTVGFKNNTYQYPDDGIVRVERRTTAVGTDIQSWNAIGSWPIRTIIVDNLSGSWLRVDPGAYIVPPYTLGWAQDLVPSSTSVSITFVNGPTGLPASSLAGDNVSCAIYDRKLGSAPGSPLLSNLQPGKLSKYDNTLIAASGVLTANGWLPAVANKRYRIFQVALRQNSDNDINIVFTDSISASNFGILTTTPYQGYRDITYSEGLDISIGAAINLSYQSIWLKTTFDVFMLYSLL